MATIQLTPQQQHHLGKQSDQNSRRHKLRELAIKQSQDDRFHFDTCPDETPRHWQMKRGLRVVEFADRPSERTGTIIGFKKVHPYKGRVPIVCWDSGITSASHPRVLTPARELPAVQQLSLF